ncbi:hypothetical protein HDU96_006608 [Phlyctochytrium bullatum]|nr:hypothetical protein HDU96_006608 [Phlyctochytrium bullatum]
MLTSSLLVAVSLWASGALAGGGASSPVPSPTPTPTPSPTLVPSSTVVVPPSPTPVPTGVAAKIKKVVVLVMENRSFNNLAGYYNHTTDIDNLIQYNIKNGKSFCNPVDVTNLSKGTICAGPNAPNRQINDPDHSLPGGQYQLFGQLYANTTNAPAVPPMSGFVSQHRKSTGSSAASKLNPVIDGLSVDKVPRSFALARHFVLFDKWFASVPGPTNPNRAFLTSATAAGHGYNDNSFTRGTLTQRSIFQALSEAGISWKNYDGSSSSFPSFYPDARFYSWVNKNAVSNVVKANQFFTDAAADALPAFSWINPECCLQYSYHPPSLVSDGEAFLKKVYEAVRASKSWESTALVITFDEHGGFADHVPSPPAIPPGDNLDYAFTQDGISSVFKFDRFGVRVPTFVISPWVPAGKVEHAPAAGTYDHTSILKFVESLWGLTPLTLRDANAPNFDHLFSLAQPRTDCPATI